MHLVCIHVGTLLRCHASKCISVVRMPKFVLCNYVYAMFHVCVCVRVCMPLHVVDAWVTRACVFSVCGH